MPRYEVLSEEAMGVLEQGWRRLISEIGVEFLHDGAVEHFRRAGQAVDGNVVRLDPDFVLAQVAAAPAEFDLLARNPERTIHASLDAEPAEEDVAACLHQMLPGDDAFAVIAVLALRGEVLQHRGLGLLELQEQRVGLVAAEHQCDPRTRADAPHPDNLARDVNESKLFQQDSPVGLQRLPVPAQQLMIRIGRST